MRDKETALEGEEQALDHNEVGKYWDGNAEIWTKLARMGYDIYRDHLNTPAFLKMLPDVAGRLGLDIGCGEGYNTRLIAGRGARMTALDISPTFVSHAQAAEKDQPLGIRYLIASGEELPFADASFDFAVGTMSFMDIPDRRRVIHECRRALRSGGFLQFSIIHPCFFTPRMRPVYDEAGNRIAQECGDYFEGGGKMTEWIFSSAPQELRQSLPKFQTPVFFWTLSEWLNTLISEGFVLHHFEEPYADDEAVARYPHLSDTRIVADFLHIRCTKP